MKENYAKAVVSLLRSGVEAGTVWRGLKKRLSEKGREKLYPSILRLAAKLARSEDESAAPRVVVASQAELKKEQAAIEKDLAELGAKNDYVTHVDASIIGGRIVSFHHRRLDRSYRRVLIDLYRSIIA